MNKHCAIAAAVVLTAPALAAAPAVTPPQTAATPFVIIGLIMIALGFFKRTRTHS